MRFSAVETRRRSAWAVLLVGAVSLFATMSVLPAAHAKPNWRTLTVVATLTSPLQFADNREQAVENCRRQLGLLDSNILVRDDDASVAGVGTFSRIFVEYLPGRAPSRPSWRCKYSGKAKVRPSDFYEITAMTVRSQYFSWQSIKAGKNRIYFDIRA